MCTSMMLDVTKNVGDSIKNIDLSKCCNTESLLLTKLWNDDDDIMGLLLQRVSNNVVGVWNAGWMPWSHFSFKMMMPINFISVHFRIAYPYVRAAICFWTPEGKSQKATLVVLVVVGISSLKIPKAFLICSRMQWNFAYTFVPTIPTHLLSQIFHLFSS